MILYIVAYTDTKQPAGSIYYTYWIEPWMLSDACWLFTFTTGNSFIDFIRNLCYVLAA